VYRGELEVHSPTGDPYAPGNISYFGVTNCADVTSAGNWTFYGQGPDGTYVETGIPNYNAIAGNNGNFTDTGSQSANPAGSSMPGLPSITDTNDSDQNGTDSIALDINTILYLTPGLYTMDVNSDDGFAVSVGNPAEWNTMKLLLGQADYGKGASDINFDFYITTTGYYPFRCVYFNGTGGCNFEWATLSPYPANNMYIALNDSSAIPAGGTKSVSVPAYQYPLGTTKGSPYISGYGPAQRRVSEENQANFTHTGYDAPIWATLVDGETAITTSSVKLAVNGVAVNAVVSKTGSVTSVGYTNPSPWVVGSTNTVALTFLDRTATWMFDVENHKNATFFIEAEDYDFGGGQTMAAASTMPYYGGAYAGKSAMVGVDYQPSGDQDDPWYRIGLNPAQPSVLNVDMDRGVNELTANFRLGWIGGGQWYNYTRTFPAGSKYNVYGGISNGGTGADGEYAILQVVTSTSTNNVGLFDGVGTGSWGYNAHLVPLTDPNLNLVEVDLSGTTTLRYWLPAASTNAIMVAGMSTQPKGGNGDWDFMMFTPAVTQPTGGLKWSNAGDEFVITYEGTLYSASSILGPWTAVSGATSPYTVPTTGAKMFFRAK